MVNELPLQLSNVLSLRSKGLLIAYLQSQDNVGAIGHTKCNEILEFLRNFVFPHEQLFARCHYLHIRAFDAYSNSCLEGTNYAVKYSTNAVRPCMSQAKATKVMVNQDEVRDAIVQKSVCDGLIKKPLYTTSITSKFIRRVAESMFQQQSDEAENYVSYRVQDKKWLVLRSTEREVGGVLPCFSRVRTVTVDKDNCMHCTCGFIERNGIPDRHIIHVARKFGVEFTSFTHHDIDLRFHNSFCKYVATDDPSDMNDEAIAIRKQLLGAREGPLNLPTAPSWKDFSIFSPYGIGHNSVEKFQNVGPSEALRYIQEHGSSTVVLNYSDMDVEKARKVAEHCGTSIGMTQQVFNCVDEEVAVSYPSEEEEAISYPTDNQPTMVSNVQSTYEQFSPLYKEITQIFDGLDESKITEAGHLLQNIVNLGKQYRVALQPQPVGQVVSCVPVNKNASAKHSKQNTFSK